MAAYAKDLIAQSLQDYKVSRLQLKRKEINRYLDFYTGTSIFQYVEPYFDIESFQEVPVYQMNITKKFVNKLSRIYTLGATRNVNKKYEDLTKHKNTSFKHIERMTRLLGSFACEISFDEVLGFKYNPIYFFIPMFDDSDPFNPIAITYPLANVDDPAIALHNQPFRYLDDEWDIICDETGTIVKEIYHGLGRIPVAFFHKEHQIDSFFVEGAMDIINCNQHIDITLTELQLGLRFQMFGQPYATGVPEAGKITRSGTDTIISLPEGATYGIASTSINIQSVIDALKFQIELVALSNHMYVQFAQDGGETPSGIALQIKDLEGFEDFKDDIELWRKYEEGTYEIERLMAEQQGIMLPEKFGVDFEEPEYPRTAQEQIMMDDWALKNGQTTRAKIMVRDNADLSIKQAEKIIEDNMSINDEQAPTIPLPLQDNQEESEE